LHHARRKPKATPNEFGTAFRNMLQTYKKFACKTVLLKAS